MPNTTLPGPDRPRTRTADPSPGHAPGAGDRPDPIQALVLYAKDDLGRTHSTVIRRWRSADIADDQCGRCLSCRALPGPEGEEGGDQSMCAILVRGFVPPGDAGSFSPDGLA